MILKNILTLVVSLSFLSAPAISFADKGQHPIDKAEEQCLSKNSTTAGMCNCTYAAQVKWDEEMNKYYLLLIKKLNKEEGLKLKEAQRAWIKFRDKEFEFINTRYLEPFEGALYQTIAADEAMEVVKARALDLQTHYDILKDQ